MGARAPSALSVARGARGGWGGALTVSGAGVVHGTGAPLGLAPWALKRSFF